MNDLLATLSSAHFGAFTAHDAYDCGYHRQSLSRLVRGGRAKRVGPSAYVDRDRYEAASPERRHEMATRAVVRTFDGRVYASHYSALTLMSLPVFGAPLDHIHVARAVDSLSRRRPGLSIHRAYGPGAGRLIGRTPSVAPALTRLLLNAIGFHPTPQVDIRDEHGRLVGRVDFLLERERIIVEFDGLMLHSCKTSRGRQGARCAGRREGARGPSSRAWLRVRPADVGRSVPPGDSRTPAAPGRSAGPGSARHLRAVCAHMA
jgi:hypothetical protein